MSGPPSGSPDRLGTMVTGTLSGASLVYGATLLASGPAGSGPAGMALTIIGATLAGVLIGSGRAQ